jgi:hypothetical protein
MRWSIAWLPRSAPGKLGSAVRQSWRCAVDAVAVPSGHGPRRRPDQLLGDRGYDYDSYRRQLRQRGIRPIIAPSRDRARLLATAASAGSSNAPSPGCISSAACSSATNAAPRSTRPSSLSAAVSSAGDDSARAPIGTTPRGKPPSLTRNRPAARCGRERWSEDGVSDPVLVGDECHLLPGGAVFEPEQR